MGKLGIVEWESSAVQHSKRDKSVRECDQKVLFILQIDKKKSNILQNIVNGNKEYGISGFVTLRNTTKRQNWSALPCVIEICPPFLSLTSM